MDLTDEDWKKRLTPEQYRVLREKGTEIPFSSDVWQQKEPGKYTCVACGEELFASGAQYESNQPGLWGWPSFSEVAKSGAVKLVDDYSYGMHRIEAQCANCGGHLGHVFDDESSPSGQHYCLNGICLKYEPETKKKA